jgi:hypothetical protein
MGNAVERNETFIIPLLIAVIYSGAWKCTVAVMFVGTGGADPQVRG